MVIYTNTDFGYETALVNVEAIVRKGLPVFDIVGFYDGEIIGEKERVKAAIKNSGFAFPDEMVLVDLSPADLKKSWRISSSVFCEFCYIS